jgi:hypothetical protein
MKAAAWQATSLSAWPEKATFCKSPARQRSRKLDKASCRPHVQDAEWPQAPVVPADSELQSATGETLEDDARIEGVSLTDLSFGGQAAKDAVVAESRLRRVNLSETRLSGLYMRDVLLDHCNLANAGWERPLLKRVAFEECRLTGWSANEARWEHVGWTGCSAQYAGFRSARFKSVRFVRCMLAEADFEGADLSGSVFLDCDLTGAQLSGARLLKTDFRGSKLNQIAVGPAELRGAIIDTDQALLVAELLGITVIP